MLQTAIDPVAWIRSHLLDGGGVCVSSRRRVAYPEVSGYLVPTLLRRGELEMADRLALWLPTVQRPDGSFADPDGVEGCAFDTGQVARGLVAALKRHPGLAAPLRRACDWLVDTASSEGRLCVPRAPGVWGMGPRGTIPEAVHLYVLPALRQAGEALGEPRYLELAARGLRWYVDHEEVTEFGRPNMLSHFFCYVQEALCELGARDLAAAGMRSLAECQQDNGAVPAFSDVPWVCSPGQLQAALVWARLGERERAERALRFLEPYGTPSQGFCGSYGVGADYFVDEEISWAAKFWLDARDALDAPEEPEGFEGEAAPTYGENLSPDAWHESITGGARAESIAASVRAGEGPPWLGTLLEATEAGERLLELGSGTGALSAALARAGRRTALLDFSPASLELSARVFGLLGLEGAFCAADVLGRLPFADGEFDVVWSSGLLEHFDAAQVDHVVAESARVARRAVLALVPNARSVPYRLGKHLQERAGTWAWGREDPLCTLRGPFERAGLTSIREWTVAPRHALEFLEDPAMKDAFTSWLDSLDDGELDRLDQGYLLVTVGECAAPELPARREARSPRRLAVVPNDPLQAYVDAGYPDLTDYFNPGGWFDEVYCLSPQETRARVQYGMQVLPTSGAEFAARVRELGIDVVRAYCLPMGSFACAHKVEGVPYLVSVHDPDPRRCPGPLPAADRFLAVSGRIEAFLRDKGADPATVTRLPNRVDLEVFRPVTDPARRAAFEARFPGRYRVLHVGRKSEEKNLEAVIGALALLGPDYVGIFVGRGAVAPYRALAEHLGVVGRCHFLDAVPNHELADHYSFADCMCTPSLWEGFGTVFIEALACGALVVTSDRAPMNELVTDGETGLLVGDPRDPAQVAAALARACTDRALASRLRGRARAAAAPFAKDRIDALEAQLYEQALRARRAAPPPAAPADAARPAARGDLRLHLLRPELADEWDRVVRGSPDAWMFHLYDEHRLLRDAYGCEDLSFLVEAGGRIAAVCPLQRSPHRPGELYSTLMGSGGPAAAGDLRGEERQRVLAAAHDVLARMVQQGVAEQVTVLLPQLAPASRAAWETGRNPLLAFGYADASSRTSVVDLSLDLDALERAMTKGHRSQLRRARRAGLEVVQGGPEHAGDYYRLHVETYTRTGVPPHPRAYFDAIFEHMVGPGHAEVLLARHRGRFVGATNVARFGDASLYWTGAYAREGLQLDAPKLLQWEAIRRGKAAGLRYHETGEVFPDAAPGTKLAGLTAFKKGFGGAIRPWFQGVLSGAAR